MPTTSNTTHSRALRLADVKQLTGLSQATIYRLVSDGRFPSPHKLTQRAVAWSESEVSDWLDEKLSGDQS